MLLYEMQIYTYYITVRKKCTLGLLLGAPFLIKVAATFIDGCKSTFVVYQSQDGSISGLRGTGPPVTELTYTTSLISAAGVARNDTPLAVAVSYSFFNVVSVVSASKPPWVSCVVWT